MAAKRTLRWLAVVWMGLLALPAIVPPTAAHAADNPIVTENSFPGSNGWILGAQIADDANGQIKGYAGATSVGQGQSLTFHVTVNPAQTYTIDFYRLGWYGGVGGRHRLKAGPLEGVKQNDCLPEPSTGLIECGWAPGYTLNVPNDWTSGVYLAVLTNAQGFQNVVQFVVRDGRPADLRFQRAITTDQAFNNYPNDGRNGKSTYSYNSYGANTVAGEPRAVKVSFDRPYADFGTGYLFSWEYQLIRWLERSGYDVTYTTDFDLHTNGSELRNHKALIVPGYDAFWSKEMYDATEGARAAGVSLAFLGAHAVYWGTRFEPSASGVPNRVMVSYKVPGLDPVQGPTTTTPWHNAPLNRSEQTLMGLQYSNETPFANNAGFVVTKSAHWAYAGTGLRDGDAIPGIVGHLVDRVFPEVPAPNATSQTVLSTSPVTTIQGTPDHSNATIYRAPSGALVFSAGTLDWSAGLDNWWKPNPADARIQRITANVLNAFISGLPLDRLEVEAPPTATAGQPFNVTVRAADAQANPIPEYAGTLHFSSSDTSIGAVLPSDSTLPGGQGSFSVTLGRPGNQTLTVSDSTRSLSKTVTINVGIGAASRLVLATTATPTVGSPFSFSVSAQDGGGNIDTGYAGTVRFTSSDTSGATLPADATLNNGQGTFSATLTQAGPQTITATDTATSSISGTLSVSVAHLPAERLVLEAPATATAGSSFTVTVRAVDSQGGTAVDYPGTVHFVTSDTSNGVQLPANATLTSGQRTFSVRLGRAGAQTVTVRDTANAALTATVTVSVGAGSAASLSVTAPSQAIAGQPFQTTVTLKDAYGNQATGYAGTVRFSSSDTAPGVLLPAESTVNSGQANFSATLIRAGSQTLTVRDTATASLTATATISVRAGPTATMTLAAPAQSTAGQAFQLTVGLRDAYGNLASGTVRFSSSDTAPGVALPPDSQVNNGQGTFSVTLVRAGSQTITARDMATSITATAGLAVAAGAPAGVSLATPSQTTAGQAFQVTVTLKDAYGNLTSGRVHFSSSDTGAGVVLPGDSTIDKQATLSATLVRAGPQTLTARETATGASGMATITVRAAAAASMTIVAPSQATVGQAFSVTVALKDAYGNQATGYAGTVSFSSTDALASLPANHTFTSGDAGAHTFSVTLRTPTTPLAQHTITVRDTANASLTATTNSISVGVAQVPGL